MIGYPPGRDGAGVPPAIPVMDGLVAWLPFYAGPGAQHDASGNQNHVYPTGGTPAFDPTYPGGAHSFATGGVYFIGTGDSPVKTGVVTVATWIKPNVTTRGDAVSIWKFGSTSTDQFDLLWGLTSGAPQFYINTGGGLANSGASSITMAVGRWYHVVGVYDGSTVAVYVNGVLGASTGAGSALASGVGNPLEIGSSTAGANGCNASLADVRLYNRALKPAEINALYNFGLVREAGFVIGEQVGNVAPAGASAGLETPTRRARPSLSWSNLALGLTAVASSTLPLNQYNWPVPTGKAPVRENRTYIQDTPLHLIGKDAIPPQRFVYDYPNPKIRPFPVQNRTHLVPVNLLLLGQDAIPPQRFQYDYPNPGRKRPPDLTIASSGLSITTVVAATAPFDQTEWPNPTRVLRSNVGFVSASLDIASVVPFAQEDWPVPARRARFDATWLNPSLDIASIEPFSQLDWPVAGRGRRVDGTLAGQGLGLTAVVNAGTPFAQLDWQNPVRLKPDASRLGFVVAALMDGGTPPEPEVVPPRLDTLGGKPDKYKRRTFNTDNPWDGRKTDKHKRRTFNPWEGREPEPGKIEPAALRKAYVAAVKADVVEPGSVAVVEEFRRPSNRVDWAGMAADVAAAEELVAVLEAAVAEQAEDDDEDAIIAMMPALMNLIQDV